MESLVSLGAFALALVALADQPHVWVIELGLIVGLAIRRALLIGNKIVISFLEYSF